MTMLRRSCYLLAVVLAVALLWNTLSEHVNAYDEGLALYNAERVLEGAVPYRDFWTPYAPGQFYTLAILFKWLGPSALVERLWDALTRLVLAVVIFLVARAVTSPKAAMFPALLALLWLASGGFHGYPVLPALLCALVSVIGIISYAQLSRPRWLWVAGVAAGLATFYRHDVGLYFVVPEVLILGAATFAMGRESQRPGAWWWRIVSSEVVYLIGLLLILGPVLVYLLAVVPTGELWSNLVAFPAKSLHRVRALPLPSPLAPIQVLVGGNYSAASAVKFVVTTWLPFYLPLAIFALAIAQVIGLPSLRARRSNSSARWGTALLTAAGILLLCQGFNRADWIHLFPASLIALILLASILDAVLPIMGRGQAVALVLITGCVLLLPYVALPVRTWFVFSHSPLPCRTSRIIPRAGGLCIDPDEQRAVCFIQSHTSKHERIFVGNARHDQIFTNDILFYFLADRGSATKYHELHPGLATTLPVQAQIVDDLIRNHVRYVVLWSGVGSTREEPNESGRSSGVNLLDRFLRTHYRRVETYGLYAVLFKV
jgi:hypothetical protein